MFENSAFPDRELEGHAPNFVMTISVATPNPIIVTNNLHRAVAVCTRGATCNQTLVLQEFKKHVIGSAQKF